MVVGVVIGVGVILGLSLSLPLGLEDISMSTSGGEMEELLFSACNESKNLVIILVLASCVSSPDDLEFALRILRVIE